MPKLTHAPCMVNYRNLGQLMSLWQL